MKNSFILLLLFFISLPSCTDVIVSNISEETVSLITPPDELTTSVQTHTLKWDALDFANGYLLEVADPSFDSIVRFLIDENIDSNRFEYTFPVGTYEWRVTPFNEAYTAQTSEIRSFTITSEAENDLTSQSITLITPETDLCTSNSNFTFAWNALESADTYLFQIGNQDFTQISHNIELTTTSHTITIEEEGLTYWRVRGENQGFQTYTSWETRQFTFDQTAPLNPSLISPINGDTLALLTDDLILSWTPASDAEIDTLFLYADINQDTLLLKTAITEIEYDLNNSTINLEIEDYYWKLNSTDKVGNTSSGSTLRSFYLE